MQTRMAVVHFVFVLCILEIVLSVPPDACFATFRWDDCGKPPVPVMYYWKPGSRCEVGLWRGCLPNPNMFQDEYECVSHCIFTSRAIPADYHLPEGIIDNNIDDLLQGTTELSVHETTIADHNKTEGKDSEFHAKTTSAGEIGTEEPKDHGNSTHAEGGKASDATTDKPGEAGGKPTEAGGKPAEGDKPTEKPA